MKTLDQVLKQTKADFATQRQCPFDERKNERKCEACAAQLAFVLAAVENGYLAAKEP